MTIAEQTEEARLRLAESAGLSTAAFHAIMRMSTGDSSYDIPQWAYVGLGRKRCVELLKWRAKYVTHAPEGFAVVAFYDSPCHVVGNDPALEDIQGLDDNDWHQLKAEAIKDPDFRLQGNKIHLTRNGVWWSVYEKHVDTDISTAELPWSVIVEGSKIPKVLRGRTPA